MMGPYDYTTELTKDLTGKKQHTLLLVLGSCTLADNVSRFIIDNIHNNNIEISFEWCSKYNEYIIYDYEPFATDGFYVRIIIHSDNYNLLGFIQHEVEQLLNNVFKLEKDLCEKPYKDKTHTEVK